MKRNWFWGIICILGAILIFGNLFGFLPFTFSLWKIIGTLICLSVIIDGIKERSFYSPLFGIAIIFYLFKEDLGFEDISLWLLLLATWLLAWGEPRFLDVFQRPLLALPRVDRAEQSSHRNRKH